MPDQPIRKDEPADALTAPPSIVKNIAFQVSEHYRLDNTPFPDDEQNHKENRKKDRKKDHKPDYKPIPFIGRKELSNKFLEFFNGNSKRGVFLVTGYRGMGKTSFVNHVIGKYRNTDENGIPRKKSRKEKIIPIHLTLAQTKPKEIDILRLLVSSVYDQYKRPSRSRLKWKFWKWIRLYAVKTTLYAFKLVLVLLLFVTGITIFVKYKECSECLRGDSVFDGSWIIKLLEHAETWLIYTWFIYLLAFAAFKFWFYRITSKGGASIRIERLMNSCYAMISEENSSTDEIHIPYAKARMSDAEKRIKQYPIAEAKQIEYELQRFLETVSDDEDLEFIFIFDELDKVEPAISTSYLYEDLDSFESKKNTNSYERELRDRKQAIINIIASLKNFFTTANARFIFITGREMFDASMADVADRQSSISSIFTYVFNIESLLKEKQLDLEENKEKNNADLTSLSIAIEEFLKHLLFAQPNETAQRELAEKSLYACAIDSYRKDGEARNEPLHIDDVGRIYFTLQNLVSYLTYRSNGSPQKLIKAVHEFILKKTKGDFGDDQDRVLRYDIYKQKKEGTDETQNNELYLYFGYHNQYRIGFINYLYRPFLILYGQQFKWFSDNIVVSTPYLFDHLLKFHPFAFSLMNLEMIPEVLSTNKTPSLREHLKQIISYLGANHVRETEISLFDYKFYSRTLHEISFLSRIFEQEAAAFNFTLDESYLIILHVRSKIKELRSIYYKFLNHDEATNQIFSISNLNEILGDLHFFNQEYDDAVTAYSDAIKPITQADVGEMDMQSFVTLIKNKLKIGLCFEKTSSHEEALAMYADCCQDGQRFIVSRLMNAHPLNVDNLNIHDLKHTKDGTVENKSFRNAFFYTAALGDVLQIISQGFLAKLFMQEKIGIEGISALKLSIGLGSFLNITSGFIEPQKRNHLLKANAFLYTGKLLYFKNSLVGFELDDEVRKLKILPANFYARLSNLVMGKNRLFREISSQKNNHLQSSKPGPAIYIYILSLYEVLCTKYTTHNSAFIKAIESRSEQGIIRKLLSEVALRIDDENFRGVHYRYTGSLLSSIGDCLLSIYQVGKDNYNRFGIADFFKNLDAAGGFEKILKGLEFPDFLNTNGDGSLDLTDILKCYYWSGKYFLKYGRKVSCSFQFNKIQHVLRVVFKTVENPPEKDTVRSNFLHMLKVKIVEPALQISAEDSANGDIHMVEKAIKYLKTESEEHRNYAVNNVSYHPESRETILLYNYIAIKIGERKTDIGNLIKSFSTVASQHSRMMELDTYAKYLQVKYPFLMDPVSPVYPDIEAYKDTIIINYLFTRVSMLRILEIYGTNYAVGYRYTAYTYFQVATVLENCEKRFSIKDSWIRKRLNQLLGSFSYTSLNAIYYYKKAKDLYEKAIQLHVGGVEYKTALSSMIYLEDDFNDNAYHFGAALDRYCITNDVLKMRVDKCAEKINEYGDYSADTYMPK